MYTFIKPYLVDIDKEKIVTKLREVGHYHIENDTLTHVRDNRLRVYDLRENKWKAEILLFNGKPCLPYMISANVIYMFDPYKMKLDKIYTLKGEEYMHMHYSNGSLIVFGEDKIKIFTCHRKAYSIAKYFPIDRRAYIHENKLISPYSATEAYMYDFILDDEITYNIIHDCLIKIVNNILVYHIDDYIELRTMENVFLRKELVEPETKIRIRDNIVMCMHIKNKKLTIYKHSMDELLDIPSK